MSANLSQFLWWRLRFVRTVSSAPFSRNHLVFSVIEFVQFIHEIRFLMQSCVCNRLSHPCLCSFLSLFGPLDALGAAGRTVFRSCCAWWPLPENVISGSNGGIKEKKKNYNTVEGQILIVLLRALGFRQAECKNLLQALSSSEVP